MSHWPAGKFSLSGHPKNYSTWANTWSFCSSPPFPQNGLKTYDTILIGSDSWMNLISLPCLDRLTCLPRRLTTHQVKVSSTCTICCIAWIWDVSFIFKLGSYRVLGGVLESTKQVLRFTLKWDLQFLSAFTWVRKICEVKLVIAL